jgi:CheY-like chemotaxis protein
LYAGRIAAAGAGATLDGPVHREDQLHIDFLRGADLLIHDAQYTAAEYPSKVGWGHTPAELAVDIAAEGGVKRLALFHHDPGRNDHDLAALAHACRVRAAAVDGIGTTLEVFAAAEGHVVTLAEHAVVPAVVLLTNGTSGVDAATGANDLGDPSPDAAPRRHTVLIVDDEPQVVKLLMRALQSEQLHLLSASDGDTALRLAHSERPDLILLDWRMPGKDGLEVCRAIRADADPHVSTMPVVLLTALTSSEETSAGFASGATDYLTKPFGMAHVRARVHQWLQRGHGSGGEGTTDVAKGACASPVVAPVAVPATPPVLVHP